MKKPLREKIKLTVQKMEKLSGGRLKIQVAERDLVLGRLALEGMKGSVDGNYIVTQKLTRGRYIIKLEEAFI